MSINWSRFDSPEEYASFLKDIPPQYSQYEYQHNYDNIRWQGGTCKDGITKLEQGDTTNRALAQEMIGKVDYEHLLTYGMPVLTPCVAGFVPNVPAAISGHPESMFRRGYIENPNISAPLTVYVNVSVDSKLTHTQILNRGIGVLAFVMAMELIRPVDLYVINMRGHSLNPGIYGSIIKVASRPMDLGRAVWMLTSVQFTRAVRSTDVNFRAGMTRNGKGPFLFNLEPQEDTSEQAYRELLQLEPTDVFIRGAHSSDRLMINDPMTWVQQMIEKHSNSTQGE